MRFATHCSYLSQIHAPRSRYAPEQWNCEKNGEWFAQRTCLFAHLWAKAVDPRATIAFYARHKAKEKKTHCYTSTLDGHVHHILLLLITAIKKIAHVFLEKLMQGAMQTAVDPYRYDKELCHNYPQDMKFLEFRQTGLHLCLHTAYSLLDSFYIFVHTGCTSSKPRSHLCTQGKCCTHTFAHKAWLSSRDPATAGIWSRR
jgi:hypothetical protein